MIVIENIFEKTKSTLIRRWVYTKRFKQVVGNFSRATKGGLYALAFLTLLPLMINMLQNDNPMAYACFFPLCALVLLLTPTFRGTRNKSRSIESIRFRYKLRKLFQKPRNELKGIICSSIVVLGLLTTFFQAFVFNAIFEALITFICVILIGWIFAPLSKKHSKRSAVRKVTTNPSLKAKAREENIKAKHRTIKNKDECVNNKNLRVKAFLVIILLVIFPTILGWSQVSQIPAICPTPTFAGMPQEARLDVLNFDYDALEFVNDPKDLEGISFNSMFVMKFALSASTNKIYYFHAKLTPLDPLALNEGWVSYSMLDSKVHDFKSRAIKGPFSEREIIVEVDINEAHKPVLPGKYKLEVYSIEQQGLSIAKMSNVHEYEVTIEKDRLYFDPYYYSDPLRSSRSGSIYSIENEETLGWENYFQAKMVDSTGKSVSGTVSLYLTQRENNQPVFKKITDYNVGNDGVISYMYLTRTQYREYMQGKIEYDGRQSLYYRTTIHRESCEVAQNKFIHTSTDLDRPEYTYNGTELDYYNLNEFKITTHLKYHTEFNLNELQWAKNPSYQFHSGTPDFIYLDVSDTSSTYVESPLIQYLGTISDYASFSYRYTFFNYGTPSDEVCLSRRKIGLRTSRVQRILQRARRKLADRNP